MASCAPGTENVPPLADWPYHISMRIEDRLSTLQQQYQRIARLCVVVFYGRFEIHGGEHIPPAGPVAFVRWEDFSDEQDLALLARRFRQQGGTPGGTEQAGDGMASDRDRSCRSADNPGEGNGC